MGSCQTLLRLYPSSAQKLVLHGSISVKAEELTVAHKALREMSPGALSDLTFFSGPCHSFPATLASWMFLNSTNTPHACPASGPLHLLFLPSGILFPTPMVLHGYLPLLVLQCQVSSIVTCPGRPVLTVLYKPLPLITLSPDFALFFLIALEVFMCLSVYILSPH